MAFSDLTEGVLSACQAAFGESVTYTPAGGSSATVTGIFNKQSYWAEPGTGIKVLTTKPSLGVKLSDLSQVPKVGDTVTVRTIDYKVIDTDFDGEGGGNLLLQKA